MFRLSSLLILCMIHTVTPAEHGHGKTSDVAKALVLAPGYRVLSYPAPKVGSYTLPSISDAFDAPYLSSQGERGTLHDLMHEKVTILSFIYTKCEDVNGCPLSAFVMSQIRSQIKKPEAVQFISYSFDLKNDTPTILENYAKSFRSDDTRWEFLTSPDSERLGELLENYNQTVKVNDEHTYSHMLRVFLIDSKKRIRNIYSTAFLHADTVTSDIETLLIEDTDPLPNQTKKATTSISKVSSNQKYLPTNGLPNKKRYNSSDSLEELEELGRQLFFDRRLSHNGTLSCGMCHIPQQGFTSNQLATAVGVEGRTVKRNTPTLLNISYLSSLFHDIRESKLEQQIWSPLLTHNEMANPSVDFVVKNIEANPHYKKAFESLFTEGVAMRTIGKAIAAYEHTLVAADSRFDRYMYAGENYMLTKKEISGYQIFNGKGQCTSCHLIKSDAALFTDELVHNTGVGYQKAMGHSSSFFTAKIARDVGLTYDVTYVSPSAEPVPSDLGRYEITQNPLDRWKYRTPTLRNIELTAPYMHNGSFETLKEVVSFYNQGGFSNPLLDPLIHPLQLTDTEEDELVAFLMSLTSTHINDIVDRASQKFIHSQSSEEK
jgi:cytochrome c peroxidase